MIPTSARFALGNRSDGPVSPCPSAYPNHAARDGSTSTHAAGADVSRLAVLTRCAGIPYRRRRQARRDGIAPTPRCLRNAVVCAGDCLLIERRQVLPHTAGRGSRRWHTQAHDRTHAQVLLKLAQVFLTAQRTA